MTVAAVPSTPARASRSPALRAVARSHPVAAFFGLAYLFSWAFWAPSALGVGGPAPALVYVGVWGPAAAGLTVTWLRGGSPRAWVKGLLQVRVPAWWWAAVLLVPLALVAVPSAAFLALGQDLDGRLLGKRLLLYPPMLVVLTLVGGGNEEWGWRGFALPALLERHRPIPATFVLGGLWAVWHLPLLAAADDLTHGLDGIRLGLVLGATVANIVALAFLYTFLHRSTGSALLCALLHGGINPANGTLVLRATELEGTAYATMQGAITATTVVLAALLVLLTRGRLSAASGDEASVAPEGGRRVLTDQPSA